MLCCVASPRGAEWEATRRAALCQREASVNISAGRRRRRLYLEPAASPPPWWTAQCRCRPAPLWRKAVGGSRTSLSLPDRISLQMSFKTRCAVFPDAGKARQRLLKISNLRVSPLRDSTCVAPPAVDWRLSS